ncbi:MAG: hypothetical protein P9X24_03135 [Candidatus Hatepunaea meridiana]|nr:hypothetical protein [Candidatus Hatepunaea meridiana]
MKRFSFAYHKQIQITCLFLYLFTASLNVIHAELYVSGFVDSYHAVRIKAPNDYLSSRTRLRTEAEYEADMTSWFVSSNLEHNEIVKSRSGLELREAYMDYHSDSWEFRVGRQIIIRGKADGVQITDIISPLDMTKFLARDYDDIRMPIDALKFRILGNSLDLELVWLPLFQAAILPSDDNPWAVKPDLPADRDITYEEPLAPEKRFNNSEFGARLSFYLSGIDFAFSGFHTWNDIPVFDQFETTDAGGDTIITVTPKHHRLTMFGLDVSKPIGDFVFRGEVGFFIGRRFEPEVIADRLFRRNSISSLMGLDYYPGNDWSVAAQINDQFTLSYDNRIKPDEHTLLATLNISKSFLRSTLKLSSGFYYGINLQDGFNRTSADYALTDELHLVCGVDWFDGSEGMYAQYRDNSEFWIKCKYSF